ncbi:hypothetical protein [Pseudohongiella spirulinae]|uniref:Uncharacterized protein n=1 Tax=Pseudohongiella spirulinae TaxID=1249552 RepID=A0A0S2KBL1_9GAMM|nr:hypothetical protein [Pseudohongiella spirulinae]ALO45718.1 hypothetical protein PS2015_1053 [Pseudohongiella spirulinae]
MDSSKKPVSTRLLGFVLLALAALCALVAVATAINLGFIMTRPDSISVVNTLIGQFVVIIGALVLAKMLLEAGRKRL